MDELEKKKKMLMIEYILTNGTLPGFFERVEESKPNWSIATEAFIVYRGHGHSKPGIVRLEGVAVNNIKESKKPISTSRNIINVLKFTDTNSCCIFEITVDPGIRFFDFATIPSDTLKIKDINDFMNFKITEDPNDMIWPPSNFPKSVLLKELIKRKDNEQEVLLDGLQGTFKPSGDETMMNFSVVTNETKRKKIKVYKDIKMRIIKKSYALKTGGGRTRRRKLSRKMSRKQLK
jgi:hypothetical protein